MTSNKLSIHDDTGDIFYENHNTGESFYNFLIAQQNEQAPFIPKKFSYISVLKHFLLIMLKNMIYMLIKMPNTYFIASMTM